MRYSRGMSNRYPPLPGFIVPLLAALTGTAIALSWGAAATVAFIVGACLRPAAQAIHENAVEANGESSYARALRALGRR